MVHEHGDAAVPADARDLAHHPRTKETDAALSAYVATHRRGRLGTIDYRASDVGLNLTDLRTRFAPYIERFLV